MLYPPSQGPNDKTQYLLHESIIIIIFLNVQPRKASINTLVFQTLTEHSTITILNQDSPWQLSGLASAQFFLSDSISSTSRPARLGTSIEIIL